MVKMSVSAIQIKIQKKETRSKVHMRCTAAAHIIIISEQWSENISLDLKKRIFRLESEYKCISTKY